MMTDTKKRVLRSLAIVLFACLFLGPVVNAQNGPNSSNGRAEERREDRGAASAGRFMIIRDHDDLIMIDGQTGCAWSRSKNNMTPGDSSLWKHEFPVGARIECYRQLEALRARAN
jgi:hypothetical protein